MAAVFPDSVYDGALTVIAGADSMELQTSADAVLCTYTLTAGDGGGTWTIANGDTSGRKITRAALSGTNASATGAGVKTVYKDGGVTVATLDVSPTVNTNSGSEVTFAQVDVAEFRDVVNE